MYTSRDAYKYQLHRAAEACGRRFVFGGPAIGCEPGQREVWLDFVGGGGH